MSKDFFDKLGTAVRDTTRLTPVAPAPTAVIKDKKPDQQEGRMWAKSKDIYWTAAETIPSIPPAVYRCFVNDTLGPYLSRMKIDTDNLLVLPDNASEQVVEEIRHFWTLKEAFASRGFLHKRGVMLYGPPGSGKTSTISLLLRLITNPPYNGIGLYVEAPDMAAMCLQMIRKIEPERPVIAIIEDIDSLCERYGQAPYLSILDGEAQVNNIVFVATTNYVERLEARLADRPSRFDTIKHVGMPSLAARRAYFSIKEPSLTPLELDEWSTLTDGLSVAHLREVIILVRCYGRSLKYAIERMEDMKVRKTSEDDRTSRLGFNS